MIEINGMQIEATGNEILNNLHIKYTYTFNEKNS